MDKKGNTAHSLSRTMRTIHPTRGLLFGALILGALLAFEIFNYSTTDFALTDLMGDLRFLDIRWATILALAFCGIDFAGIARLFTPEKGSGEPREVWYLFGAWLLAATMNAMLTWWGVAIAFMSHTTQASSIIPSETLLEVVPIFVAIMVWVIRVLIIGSLSLSGNHLFSQAEQNYRAPTSPLPLPTPSHANPNQVASFHPTPKPESRPANAGNPRNEPSYPPASMSGTNHNSPGLRK